MYISVLIVEQTCNRYNIQSELLLVSCSVFSCKDLSIELGSFCPFFSLFCCSCSFRIIFRISSLLVFILGRGNQSVKFIGSSKLRMGFWKERSFGYYCKELQPRRLERTVVGKSTFFLTSFYQHGTKFLQFGYFVHVQLR